METEPRNNNQETEQSFAHVDFVPPEHSYIVNEQFNSAFFKDHCEEEYTIHRAFNASNFTGLRKNIPNALKHGAILDHRIQQVQRNMNVETSNRQKPATLKEEEHRDRVQKRKL